MRPVLSVAEMRAADARAAAEDAGAVERLVHRAGGAVAHAAIDLLGSAYGRRVVVVAGRGNNGADGRVAAAVLARRGAHVTVIPASGRDQPPPRLPAADLVIDAAYGTGFTGTYEAPDTGPAPVLAVDIPSGVDGDTGQAGPDATRAAVTVTFAAWKLGLLLGEGPQRAGTVVVADIGLEPGPAGAHLVGDEDLIWIPPRSRHAHKWQRAVLVVAGSPGMAGAAALTVRGAQRAGAGMVRVGSPGVQSGEHLATEAVALTLPAAGWDVDVLAQAERFGAVVAGPGLGRTPATAEALRRLVSGSPVPVVVDADGLVALGGAHQAAEVVAAAKSPVIFTPHDGEFARLWGDAPGSDRVKAVRRLASRTGAVVLLKGSTTLVAGPDGDLLLSASGDARLATAGTGDVLAGVIGALLAAGLEPVRAAALGAHVHGQAARRGPAVGLVAGDVAEHLPDVLSPPPRPGG